MADEVASVVPPLAAVASERPAAPSAPAAHPSLQDQYAFDDFSGQAPPAVQPTLPESRPGSTPQPAPAAPAPQKPKHSQYLLQMAGEFGISQEEADSYSPEQLGNTVHRLTRERLADRDARSREKTIQEALGAVPPVQVPPQSQEAAAAALDREIGIDANRWEPELVGAFRNAATRIASQENRIKALEAQVAGLAGHVRQAADESRYSKIDREFMGMPAELKAMIGDGTREAVKPDSPEMARRLAILGEAARLAGPGASESLALSLIQTAARNLFGTRNAEAPPVGGAQPPPAPSATNARPRRADGTFMSDAEIEQQRWLDAGLARPTNRNGAPEPPSKEKAERAVAKLLNEFGTPEGQETLADEFLPGPVS